MVREGRVDRHLCRRATWDVVATSIVDDVDDGDGAPAGQRLSHVLQDTGCLQLARRNGI